MANFIFVNSTAQAALASSAQAAYNIFTSQVLVTSMTIVYTVMFTGNCWKYENVLGLTSVNIVDPPRCACSTCVSLGYADSSGCDLTSILLHEMVHCCGMIDVGPYWAAVNDTDEFEGMPLRIETSSESHDRLHFADTVSDTIMVFSMDSGTIYSQLDNKSLSVLGHIGFKILKYESSSHHIMMPLWILLIVIINVLIC